MLTKRDPYTLQMGMEACLATPEINTESSQKSKIRPTAWHNYVTVVPQGLQVSICQGRLSSSVHLSPVHSNQATNQPRDWVTSAWDMNTIEVF